MGGPPASSISILTTPVLPPIPTVGMTPANVDDLTKDTREAMLKALLEFSKEPPVDYRGTNGDGAKKEL